MYCGIGNFTNLWPYTLSLCSLIYSSYNCAKYNRPLIGIFGFKVDWCSYKFMVEEIIKDLSFFMDMNMTSSNVVISKSSGFEWHVPFMALYKSSKSFLSWKTLWNNLSLYFLLGNLRTRDIANQLLVLLLFNNLPPYIILK